MTKDEFVSSLLSIAPELSALPVSRAIVDETIAILTNGAASWWTAVELEWKNRRFEDSKAPAYLFLAAVHDMALADESSPLRRFFPSCGGTASTGLASALSTALAGASRSFFLRLASHRRTHRQPWMSYWLYPATSFFGRRQLPYYLVEIECVAGMNLAVDMIYEHEGFRQDLVKARLGLDAEPLDVMNAADRRWLKAGVFPDAVDHHSDLDREFERYAYILSKDKTAVQVAKCSPSLTPKFLGAQLPKDDDAGLLLATNLVARRLSADALFELKRGIASALRPWGDRALWVEFEAASGGFDVRCYRMVNGLPAQKTIRHYARLNDGLEVRDPADAAEFLTV